MNTPLAQSPQNTQSAPSSTSSSRPSEVEVEKLAERVKVCKKVVDDYKYGYLHGKVTYDDLAEAGRDLSLALYKYARAKFPQAKARRIPYQSLIR